MSDTNKARVSEFLARVLIVYVEGSAAEASAASVISCSLKSVYTRNEDHIRTLSMATDAGATEPCW